MSTEQDLVRFIARMVHDLGGSVAEIRALADALSHHEGSRSQEVKRISSGIARAAEDLALGLRMMRFFGAESELVACGFVSEILEPVASFLTRRSRGSRIHVSSETRRAPRIEVRPGPARRGLLSLFGATGPGETQCEADVNNDDVVFRLIVRGAEVEEDSLEAAVCALSEAGAVTEVRNEQGRTFRVTLRLKRAADDSVYR